MRFRPMMLAVALTVAPVPAAAAAAGDYVKPLPGPIVRHFEPPPTPYAAGHRGIDIAAPSGTAVVASADGAVAFAGSIGGELFVSIDHADGIRTTYSFLSVILTARGRQVAQGETIARSGPGHAGSAADHLHFGALLDGSYIDPERLLLDALRRNLWRVVRLAPADE